jgi:hypothetical protein
LLLPCCCIWLSEPSSQDLSFRTSIFGSHDLGFKISVNGHWVSGSQPWQPKALHPTVVLFFSRHFSLRPMVTDGRTQQATLYIRLPWIMSLELLGYFFQAWK